MDRVRFCFFEDIENKPKILHRLPPRLFVCGEKRILIEVVRIHQMMAKFINCRGQLTDVVEIRSMFNFIAILPNFLSPGEELKHMNTC